MDIIEYLEENSITFMPINVRKVKDRSTGKIVKKLMQDPITGMRPSVQDLENIDLVSERINHYYENPNSYNTLAIDTTEVHQIDMDIDYDKLEKTDKNYIKYVHENLPYYLSMGKGYKHIFFREDGLKNSKPKFRESIKLSKKYINEKTGKKEDIEILKGQWAWCDIKTTVRNADIDLDLVEHEDNIEDGCMKTILDGLEDGNAPIIVKENKTKNSRNLAKNLAKNSTKNSKNLIRSEEVFADFNIKRVKEIKLDGDYSIEYVEEVLDLINVKYLTDFDAWRAIGWSIRSLHESLGTDRMDLLDLYERVSKKSSSYEDGCCRKIFKSYKPGYITVGTLLHYARESDSVEYAKLKTKYFGNEGISFTDDYNFYKFAKEFQGKDESKGQFRMEDLVRKLSRCAGFVAGKNIYFIKNSEGFDRMSDRVFNSCMRRISVKDSNGKKKNMLQVYEDYADKFTYEKIVFDPRSSYLPCEGTLNTWAGFNSTYVNNYDVESFNLITQHMKDIICGKDDECYKYLLGWLATIVQKRRKTGKCIVLISKQGAGKGVFVNNLTEKLLGSELCNEVNNIKDITGKFNAHQEGKILTVLDEAINYTSSSDYHSTFNIMKNKITEPYQLIEQKGVNKYKVRDFNNYIVCSNNSNPIKLEGSDRRYVVFNVSNDKIGDNKYFDDLIEQIEDQDNVNQFYSYLMDYDLSEFNINNIPITDIKKEISANCLSSEKKFLRYISLENYEDSCSDYMVGSGPIVMSKGMAYNRYVGFCEDAGLKPYSKIMFGKKIKDIKGVNEKRTSKFKGIQFNLDEIRKMFV